MFRFKYRYCKTHMAKYISGDLSDVARRRIARFIDERQDCYDEYMRQRAVADHLRSSLPILGRPDARRLDNIWLSLSAELAPAHAGAASSAGMRAPGNQTAGYAAIMLLLGVALLLPFALGLGSSFGAVELPQRPQVAEVAVGPAVHRGMPRLKAAATPSRLTLPAALLKNTPAPHFMR